MCTAIAQKESVIKLMHYGLLEKLRILVKANSAPILVKFKLFCNLYHYDVTFRTWFTW